MKLAIADACIFIDLYELQLTVKFFALDLYVHTSLDVFNELYSEQQEVLLAFQSVGKLTIHVITETERIAIIKTGYPKALSEMDKTVLYLAGKLDAIVLSSDKAVRNFAKNNSIPYHGMLWIFDKLIEGDRILKTEASLKLKTLIKRNVVFQNNAELVSEMDKRLKRWAK